MVNIMTYTETIEDIQNLPHYREYSCPNCGYKQKAYILEIQRNCEKCGSRSKLRRFASIGAEIEDVVDAVFDWMGKGKDFENALRIKQEMDQFEE